jgi:hypothetical protein
VAAVLATLGALLALTGVALASCPAEQSVHCPPFSSIVHGHRYRVSRITVGLNGRPTCAYARTLILAWLQNPADRVYDPVYRSYWFKTGSHPLEFTAGLCGFLRFRT